MGVSHLLAQSMFESDDSDFYPASPPYYQKRQKLDDYRPDRYAMATFCYASQPIPSVEDDGFQWTQAMLPDMSSSTYGFSTLTPYTDTTTIPPPPPLTPDVVASPAESLPPIPHSYPPTFDFNAPEQALWMTSHHSNVYPYSQQPLPAFPTLFNPPSYGSDTILFDPSRSTASLSAGCLSPIPVAGVREVRATSMTSNNSSGYGAALRDPPRSSSPNVGEMARWGYRNEDGSWSCAYPGCSSRSIFHRGCDLRKHYKRHSKTLFCRTVGCPQSTEGGFSSKKDRARHEAKHNPNIVCEWEGCDRLFSRVDNMKDHVRRVHKNRSCQ